MWKILSPKHNMTNTPPKTGQQYIEDILHHVTQENHGAAIVQLTALVDKLLGLSVTQHVLIVAMLKQLSSEDESEEEKVDE